MDDETIAARIREIFDHPTGESPWYTVADSVPEDLPPIESVHVLTAFFEDPTRYLSSYSDTQIADGSTYLLETALSSYALALLDPSVDLALRLRAVAAIPIVFDEVFAVRCLPDLSHAKTTEISPLNMTCYMWWDFFPTWGAPRRDVDTALLNVMTTILATPSSACREAALHGLGHWRHAYPDHVHAIIGRFLQLTPPDDPLRKYAQDAHFGCVQ